MISSRCTKHVCQCSPRSTCSISLSNVAGVLTSSKGITFYSYSPPVVANAVFSWSWGSSSTCQYSLIKSRIENHMEPLKALSESLILGSGYESLIVTLFKCLKSVHILILPFFLWTRTTGAAQRLFDGTIIHWSNSLLISFFLLPSSTLPFGQALSCLFKALNIRFKATSSTELFRVQMKTRMKKRTESLSELAQDIKPMARQAYPLYHTAMREPLALDCFVDAIPEQEMSGQYTKANQRRWMQHFSLPWSTRVFDLLLKRSIKPRCRRRLLEEHRKVMCLQWTRDQKIYRVVLITTHVLTAKK